MNNTLGVVFSYSERENLRELTKIRTLSSLPIGGKYRIIDLILSNFVNSGIYDVSIITKSNYHSLIDHLGSGKDWDLTRKRGGLRVLTPFANYDSAQGGIYNGTIDALAGNLNSIKRSMADYVIMTGTTMIYSMDYADLMRKHIERNADITAVYTRSLNGSKKVPLGVDMFYMNEEERIYDLTYNGDEQNEQDACWGMSVFLIRKSLLESLVSDAMSLHKYDFHEDVLKRLAPNLHILGYEYKGHLMEISGVTSYMQANLSLLDNHIREQVFNQPIYTKVKDSVPAIYTTGCKVENSIISDGCRIEGTVRNSVLSRGVKVGKGSCIEDCIVMQNTEIMKNVSLKHVILDKDVIVRDNKTIAGHETYPVVVEKMSIV